VIAAGRSLVSDTLIAAAASCRRAVAFIGTLMGYAAGWGFILCSAFITFDVIARRFFGFSSQATTELTGYALAFGISWALAHALTTRAHIRIDVLINHLPDRLRYPMHLVSLAALGVFIGFIAKGAYDLVDESILFRATDISVLHTPLWLPQGLWAFGIFVFLALIVLLFIESLLLVLAGRGREAEALIHMRTYQEEVTEALEATGLADTGLADGKDAAP
jgi:TRAP-type C4-dicarboxylate transport system permease small subunit